MKKLAAVAIVAVLAVQVLALAQSDRRIALWAGVGAAILVLATVRWFLVRAAHEPVDESRPRDPAESLRRWRARTEILITRADSNRADWDKHLRPVLARQFELATGQRKSKDAKVFHETATALFGDRLWPWVDPDNGSRGEALDALEPGPGRAVLNDVLERLEAI